MKTKIINYDEIDLILEDLKKNHTVFGMKTDTVYGMMCNANDEVAIDKIYKIKNRDKNKPIGIFINKNLKNNGVDNVINYLSEFVDFNDGLLYENKKKYLYNIINDYWPGALSIVFKCKNNNLSNSIKCINNNDMTLNIRMPNDDNISNILSKSNVILAQTSCNISNETDIQNFEELVKQFDNKLDYIIKTKYDIYNYDKKNISSTIIDLSSDKLKIIRQGSVKICL